MSEVRAPLSKMTQPTIYIHPGIGKAATSAIQNIAYTQLQQHPITQYCQHGLRGNVHNILANIHAEYQEDEFVEALEGIVALPQDRNYFISCEFLCHCTVEHIKRLCTAITDAGFKVEVIFVIRDIAKLLLSSYLQALKSGHGLVKGESYFDYAHRSKNQSNFNGMINKWKGLPEVEIKLLDFDLHRAHFIDVFFSIMGIDPLSLNDSQYIVNESLLVELIPLVQSFDKKHPDASKEERQEFMLGLQAIATTYKGISDNSSYLDSVAELVEELQSKQNKLLSKNAVFYNHQQFIKVDHHKQLKTVSESELWIDKADYKLQACYLNLDEHEQTQVDFFVENGYIIFKNDVAQSLIEEYKKEYQQWRELNKLKLASYEDQEGYLPRLINLHEKFDSLKTLYAESKALAFQDLLFQQETSLYTSLYFERGTSQSIHRDIPYFWTDPSNHYFGMWVALEDSNERNGALIGIPGGHKLKDCDRAQFATKLGRNPSSIQSIDMPLWDAYQAELKSRYQAEGLKQVSLVMEKGDVIVWHPLFPHGGGAIAKPTPTRSSVVFHSVPKNTPVYLADTFFNPDKMVPTSHSWPYQKYASRLLVKQLVNIGHKDEFNAEQLVWPESSKISFWKKLKGK